MLPLTHPTRRQEFWAGAKATSRWSSADPVRADLRRAGARAALSPGGALAMSVFVFRRVGAVHRCQSDRHAAPAPRDYPDHLCGQSAPRALRRDAGAVHQAPAAALAAAARLLADRRDLRRGAVTRYRAGRCDLQTLVFLGSELFMYINWISVTRSACWPGSISATRKAGGWICPDRHLYRHARAACATGPCCSPCWWPASSPC